MARITKACPMFASADIHHSVAWYRDRLGFSVERDRPDYGIVRRGMVEIHFRPAGDGADGAGGAAYFRVEDVDALYREMRDATEGGAVAPPSEGRGGLREFDVQDPDGNLLRFGRPSAGPAMA